MPLISGLIEAAGRGVRGPAFATQYPRMEYHGSFSIRMPILSWLSRAGNRPGARPPAFLAILGLPIVADYVSQLADRWDPPGETLEVQPARYGSVDVPVVTGRQLAPIACTFLEDSIGSVHALHAMWLRGIFAGGSGGSALGRAALSLAGFSVNGMCAYPLGAASLELALTIKSPAPNGSLRAGGVPAYEPLPTAQEVFPFVYPQSVEPAGVDMGGQNVATVTVSYGRVPVVFSGLGSLAAAQAVGRAEGALRAGLFS